ncbi:MAG: hypothetical protein H0Z19_08490 [Archaeoglobus sp.]|uniref:hypothetical protein n=1 Tax=Archaeoglobus sp. TaxID=1872626 RepID=UPI001DDB2D8B|nr:hypothetical protein [Archaeoglobus sp.]MBO8180498.1 hypothetical protein [Archaeoglobus sp.]
MESRKISLELPAELVEFLKRFCEWAGYDLEGYIRGAIILDVGATLDNIDIDMFPKAKEFWEELEELKEKYL